MVVLAPTSIVNHALAQHNLPTVHLGEEGTRTGFWGMQPTFEEVEAACRGKLFLNCDDEAFGPPGLLKYLHGRFPEPCRYEHEAKEEPPQPTVGHDWGYFQTIA